MSTSPLKRKGIFSLIRRVKKIEYVFGWNISEFIKGVVSQVPIIKIIINKIE